MGASAEMRRLCSNGETWHSSRTAAKEDRHRERFFFAVFARPQTADRGFIARIYDELKAAESFEGEDFTDRRARVGRPRVRPRRCR